MINASEESQSHGSQSHTQYRHQEIEAKWQKFWEDNETFRAEVDLNKPKFYVLDMFPYPSGAGLHVGHPEGYTATDIVARFKRMRGFNVLHPMGWDAFGLPAEQYALETGTHPAITTKNNIANFKRQIQSLGFSYDWQREVSTCDPDYYRWTQWIFCQLYKKGLAYMDEVPVNWCPALGTVLANEEVIDGKSERGGHDVIRRPMKQWMLRITDYAQSLLNGLQELDWPDGVKEMQRNWIGKSEGAEVRFRICNKQGLEFVVFTTRPDTLFGATYAVLAPEHPLVDKISSAEQFAEVDAYRQKAIQKTDRQRQEEITQKSGVFTGAYAINPVNSMPIPIYIADYVLSSYGTGAIMAVPGHDQRDWDFAQKYEIPIVEVVSGGDISESAYEGDGLLVNSSFLDGLHVDAAKEKMMVWLEEEDLGTRKINYKLRDWLFSRQRYWGEPFPIVHVDSETRIVDESALPVLLPEVEKYQPTEDGQPPLARAKNWVEFVDPESGKIVLRETNTMPQWAGSCWYYLRYLDPKNSLQAWSEKEENYWMPVDLYIGGTEHAVLHLLYSRFWHHVLYDLGLVSTKEPFKKLVNQGMILGEDNQKMSKSRGNVINPDAIVSEYGADTLRIYEMFMGPLEQVKPWNTKSVGGAYKFLGRVWRLIIGKDGGLSPDISHRDEPDNSLEKSLHRLIKKVTEDIEQLKFHTAIAALMGFLNEASQAGEAAKSVIDRFVLLLSPFAPHISEELWQRLGHTSSLSYQPWPSYDPDLAKEDSATIAVQVNGKLRGTFEVPIGTNKEDLIRLAGDIPKVKKWAEGKEVVKVIAVVDKLVNLVVK